MAPGKATKKQTRLAFASAAAPSGPASPEQSSRYSTLQYSNPGSGVYRAKPHKIKTETKVKPRAKPKKQSRLPTQNAQAASKLNGTRTSENFLRLQNSLLFNTDQFASADEPDDSSSEVSSQKTQAAHPSVQIVLNNSAMKLDKSESSKKPVRALKSSGEQSSLRQKRKRKAPSSPIVLSDSDEPIISSSVQKRRRGLEESTSAKAHRDDDDDSDMPLRSSAVKRLRRGQDQNTPVKPRNEEDDDSDLPIRSSAVKRLRRGHEPKKPSESSDGEDDSDQPIHSSPVKKLRRGQDIPHPQTPRTPRDISNQARLDLAEDLDDLRDSVLRKSRTRGHVAGSARDNRLKNLEILRRRRAGLKEEESEDESEEQSDSDIQEVDQNDNKISPSTRQLSRKNQPEVDSDVESTITANEDLDRYEDDFVLEDEQNDLGVPTEGIPLEFTRHAYKQPKDYFRDVVYWMVQNKLNPAFPRSDPMFRMAFAKLEDEVKGRSGSQLISSVWTPEFIYAIQARPSMEITAFPTEEDHPCDACRRSGHPASFDLKPYDKAYSLETLEPLNEETSDSDEQSKDDDNSEDDGKERDRDGHILPPEGTHFYLGRTCKGRADLAHTLIHWRYHLNEWVIDYLNGSGHMHDDEILRRNNLSTKKKTRHANHVLDQMVACGIVDGLWRDFHISLRTAREKESLFA
ncbi:hypothetical protein PENANT_c009G09930 [Penicillium antarcticum]|uniref:DUF4211 domain-containing protein n=1 Tax=Penicillium antarcticum TaxID=416450 RepID=A0A1V6Q8U3_9EURO|nr:uncharacterized protein N7508_006321 [Penicillium antarcticum]KAJ5301458.1 hypothetical protein N7508_006321 [Penicillium antarcticum]OQD85618.1 hypothetical protein PENANT_c009G09930 [Penicillium antarcticum]